jgi:glycine/D-amino acid oxidase-like deaminating enzyme
VTPDVLVIGGGIVGCAVASECARRGMAVTLCERASLASGASALDLALIPRDVDASRWLELHHFTGGSFFLDRSPPDEWPARRIDARAATAALAAEARSHGAEIRTGCDVKALLRRADAIGGALTDAGRVSAPTTVLAAGVDSWRLCAALGIALPIRAVSGEHLVLSGCEESLAAPRVEDDAWVAPLPSGHIAVSRPERAPLSGLAQCRVLSRRILSDSAFAEPAPEVEGLHVACPYGSWGAALAPVAASGLATALA